MDMKHLDAAINELKKDKSRDPNGWINEIFMEGIAGNDLKLSLLVLFNRIKSENDFPGFIRKADVATIYIREGPKM
jgi:hypothetical protein